MTNINLTERIDEALATVVANKACMSIPARSTDVDVVLADCKNEIGSLRQQNAELQERIDAMVTSYDPSAVARSALAGSELMRAEVERMKVAEAEAMALVLSHEERIKRLLGRLADYEARHTSDRAAIAAVKAGGA